MATFAYNGMNELVAALAGNRERIPRQVSLVTRKAGLDIEAAAKVSVPVDTGATKNSIGMDVEESGGEIEVTVGPATWYAPLLEAGTSSMPPRPFMGSAFDGVAPGWMKAVAQVAKPTGI
jgi:HK97 gp10 family phage protein